MENLGAYLREMRNKCNLTLKDVQQECGITDSKLSRLERGEGKELGPCELKKLAKLYGISIVPLYVMAGYLDKYDLSEYQLVFENADLLTEEEWANIQTEINLLTRGRQVASNDL